MAPLFAESQSSPPHSPPSTPPILPFPAPSKSASLLAQEARSSSHVSPPLHPFSVASGPFSGTPNTCPAHLLAVVLPPEHTHDSMQPNAPPRPHPSAGGLVDRPGGQHSLAVAHDDKLPTPDFTIARADVRPLTAHHSHPTQSSAPPLECDSRTGEKASQDFPPAPLLGGGRDGRGGAQRVVDRASILALQWQA